MKKSGWKKKLNFLLQNFVLHIQANETSEHVTQSAIQAAKHSAIEITIHHKSSRV